MRVRVMSYNLNRYNRDRGLDEEHRFALAEKVIRSVNPDVLLVQELNSQEPGQAVASAERLAAATGLTYKLDNGPGSEPTHTIVPGRRSKLALGIMWQPNAGIQPVAESWRVKWPDRFWHALAMLTIDADGAQVDYACYHGPPQVGRPVRIVHGERVAEGRLVVEALTGPGCNPLTVGAGDYNTKSTDLKNGKPYDSLNLPEDLSPELKWLASQTLAGNILRDSGLTDVATAVADPDVRRYTSGHWPDSKYGARRIDIFRVTQQLLPAIVSYDVIETPDALAASDHLPPMFIYDTNLLQLP